MQPTSKRRIAIAAAIAVVLLTIGIALRLPPGDTSGSIPFRLSKAEYWTLLTDFSEPGGYFRSDNFLSNETGYQEVIPQLRKTVHSGGVYIGVGPEQNFTYIAAIQPRIAFIIDIRRQNMLEHLLYKAFMELSGTRADFVSRLFARPRPPGLDSASTAEVLFQSYESVQPSRELFESSLQSAMEQLRRDEIPSSFLTIDDQKDIRKVYEAFFESGPELTYTFLGTPQRFGRGGMPSYSTLMTATDNDGRNWSYLANEDNFNFVRELQRSNRIVPLTGDFAGAKTLRSVGKYAGSRHATVAAFYVSNVEQYLFQQSDDWSRFYSNVAVLPLDGTSTIIRSTVFGRSAYGGRGRIPSPLLTVISPIENLMRSFQAGQIHGYYDVVGSSR